MQFTNQLSFCHLWERYDRTPGKEKFLLSAWKSFELAECLEFNILPSFSFTGEECIESVYMPRVLLGPGNIRRTNKAEGLSWRLWLLYQRKRKALPIFLGHDGEPRLGSTSLSTIKIICKVTEGKAGVGALSRKWVGGGITRKSSCSEQKTQHIRRGHSHKRA